MKNKTIKIKLYKECSTFIDDVKENFKNSKAFKYLENYNQLDVRNYEYLFKDVNMYSEQELEEIENFYIVNISARGYSKGDYQEWDLYFDKTILKDSEAMEELKYFKEDMKYYFTEQDLYIVWEIQHEKEFEWEIYTKTEALDGLCFSFGELDEKEVQHAINDYLLTMGIDKQENNIDWDIENIIY